MEGYRKILSMNDRGDQSEGYDAPWNMGGEQKESRRVGGRKNGVMCFLLLIARVGVRLPAMRLSVDV